MAFFMRCLLRFRWISGAPLLLCGSLSFARRPLDTTAALRAVLSERNRVASAYFGHAGSPSRLWNAFGLLLYRSAPDELVALSNSSHPAVRTWGYIGLLTRADRPYWYTLPRVRRDTAMVLYQDGCDVMDESVRSVVGGFNVEMVIQLQKVLASDPRFRGRLYAAVLQEKALIPDFRRQ